MSDSQLFGGIEAGGTKFICIAASGPDHILKQVRFPTAAPDETLGEVVRFFQPFTKSGKINAIGVGCFGPLDLDSNSPTFGFITSTPKAGWSHTDVRGVLQRGLGVDIVIDTDVNAAALGEFRWGAARGLDPSLYLTIGTGIGGGYIKDGRPLKGLLAPEMGHLRIPHDRGLDPFDGVCPFHGDCFEGLANGPAIEKRLGIAGADVPEDDPYWEIEAGYIAAALVNYILVLSPKRIVLGGGVMSRSFLFPKIRSRVLKLLNDYVASKSITENIDSYIVPPGLGKLSGVLGAAALAGM